MQLARTLPIHTALGTISQAFETASPKFVRVEGPAPTRGTAYESLTQAEAAARAVSAGEDRGAMGLFWDEGSWFAAPLAIDYRQMGPNGEDLGWTSQPLDMEGIDTYGSDFWSIAQDEHLVRIVDGAATLEGPTPPEDLVPQDA